MPFGQYLLLKRLAVGGMAELYLAKDTRHDRLVVIKRILPYLAQEAEFVQMFLDEARIAAQLHHPHIITVYELGRLEGSIFIAMEYVEGVDVRKIFHKEQARKSNLPPNIAAWLTAQLCDGLYYAHNRVGADGKPMGIIHRDVSPQNLMVGFGGEVKLVDFGIAKAGAFMERSKPGVIKGKFLYLSPEQLSQERIDHRSDLFAVGTMLYELCVGKSPFYKPTTEAVIYAIRAEDPAPPHLVLPKFPERLSRIIMRCLAKDRAKRYQQANEVQEDLEAFLRSEGKTTVAHVREYVAALFDEQDRTALLPPQTESKAREKVTASGSVTAEAEVQDERRTVPLDDGRQTQPLPRRTGPRARDAETAKGVAAGLPLSSTQARTKALNPVKAPPLDADVAVTASTSEPMGQRPSYPKTLHAPTFEPPTVNVKHHDVTADGEEPEADAHGDADARVAPMLTPQPARKPSGQGLKAAGAHDQDPTWQSESGKLATGPVPVRAESGPMRALPRKETTAGVLQVPQQFARDEIPVRASPPVARSGSSPGYRISGPRSGATTLPEASPPHDDAPQPPTRTEPPVSTHASPDDLGSLLDRAIPSKPQVRPDATFDDDQELTMNWREPAWAEDAAAKLKAQWAKASKRPWLVTAAAFVVVLTFSIIIVAIARSSSRPELPLRPPESPGSASKPAFEVTDKQPPKPASGEIGSLETVSVRFVAPAGTKIVNDGQALTPNASYRWRPGRYLLQYRCPKRTKTQMPDITFEVEVLPGKAEQSHTLNCR